MQVTPVSKTLAELFRSNFLRIPRFQRPYSWDKENLTDFWVDLVERNHDEYFMGSVVIHRDGKEKNVFYVVDGQQRMTTIAIMLAVIRDEFDKLDAADLAAGVHGLIEAKDLDNKSRFVIEHEPKNEFLQTRIQQRVPDASEIADSIEDQALSDAHKYLSEMVVAHLEAKASKGTVAVKAEQRKAALIALRDRLLALDFISIELTNEDDAYLIFETLNTRGKDLQISDLVKNLFTRLIKVTTKGMDVAKDKWADVLETLASVNTAIDPDVFLLHYWLATQSYVSKARLFKEMKGVIDADTAKDYLKDIVSAADIYVSIVAPNERKWKKEERELRDSLAALGVFRVAQALPLVLSVMRLYRADTISLASTKRAIQLIEKFTFQFNAIAEGRGGGGVAAMYAKLAQAVDACEDSQQFSTKQKDIRKKLEERMPTVDEFSVGFERIRFSSEFTRDRPLVRYILRKLSEHYGLQMEVDGSLYTIEHIKADSSATNEDWQSVWSLGNMIFVSEAVNQDLKTKPFPQKLKILKDEQVPMDPILAKATKWSAKEIDQRTEALAEVSYNKIWAL